jgi:hypothetical protein
MQPSQETPIQHAALTPPAPFILQHAVLARNSTATSEFIHSDAPLFTNYFLFNVTNPDNVTNHGAIPKLEQLGPYAYR